MQLNLLHVRPNFRRGVYVQWTLERPDLARTAGVTFSVERSGSPTGEWERVATGLDTLVYEDILQDGAEDATEINQATFRHEIWYRVVAHFPDGFELTSTPVDNMNGRATRYDHTDRVGIVPREEHTAPDRPNLFHASPNFQKRLHLVQRAILRRAAINLRLFSGTEFVLLKCRKFGTRCTNCYNPATKQSLLSNCRACYGTGFEKGFWTPVIVSVLLRRNPTQLGVQASTEYEVDEAEAHFVDFPRVERDDVIISRDSGDAWLLTAPTRVAALKQRGLTQSWRCAKLNRQDGPYSVPLDLTQIERAQTPIVVELTQ